MRSKLLKNNLNNFFQETLLIMLLLLASSIASYFDRFLGICSHPSFVIQLNILKTLIIAFGVLGSFQQYINIPFITFFLCFIWCSNFSRLLSVFTRWPFVFLVIISPIVISIYSSTESSTWLLVERLKIVLNPFHLKDFFVWTTVFFYFLTILPAPFS
jgi:hypothetical protein